MSGLRLLTSSLSSPRILWRYYYAYCIPEFCAFSLDFVASRGREGGLEITLLPYVLLSEWTFLPLCWVVGSRGVRGSEGGPAQ